LQVKAKKGKKRPNLRPHKRRISQKKKSRQEKKGKDLAPKKNPPLNWGEKKKRPEGKKKGGGEVLHYFKREGKEKGRSTPSP